MSKCAARCVYIPESHLSCISLIAQLCSSHSPIRILSQPESSFLKTHLLVDSLILSWVPLGSLVLGGWDLAGGLAKGLGGWGGHLDGMSLKNCWACCREMSLGKYRDVEDGFWKCLWAAAKGLSESDLVWLRCGWRLWPRISGTCG